MTYDELVQRNEAARQAVQAGVVTPGEIGEANLQHPFRGFVECVAAAGEDSFVMFTNADDVVAGHYFYSGPASFHSGTLRIWTHLARQSTWIYDIGAFTGVFSLAAVAANPECFVMAFEPSSVTYARLLVNIYANAFDARIAPLRFGAGADQGELELRHPFGVYVMSSGESFVKRQIADPWFTEKVGVVSLDHLLAHQSEFRTQLVIATEFARADLIKIDVEGFERDVLKGMEGILRKHRPTAVVEILDPLQIAEVLELFGPGYEVYNIDETNGSLSKFLVSKNKLFVHESQLHRLGKFLQAG